MSDATNHNRPNPTRFLRHGCHHHIGGHSTQQALKAPLNHVLLMATGGVSPDNAPDFFRAGADLIGVGGAVVSAELVKENRFDEIRRRAAQLIASL